MITKAKKRIFPVICAMTIFSSFMAMNTTTVFASETQPNCEISETNLDQLNSVRSPGKVIGGPFTGTLRGSASGTFTIPNDKDRATIRVIWSGFAYSGNGSVDITITDSKGNSRTVTFNVRGSTTSDYREFSGLSKGNCTYRITKASGNLGDVEFYLQFYATSN